MAQNKRIECQGPTLGFEVVNRPIPQPPPNGAIVKCHYSGICHSDVHFWRSKMKIDDTTFQDLGELATRYKYPSILGHEISGEVHSLGSNYKGDLAVGDLVAVHPWCGCEAPDCGECKGGEPIMCPKSLDYNIGIGAEGGFQHYVPVEEGKFVVKVPPAVPMPILSNMTCGGITSFKAVCKLRASMERALKMRGEAKVMIIGAGGVGLWAIQWAKAVYPNTKVYVADVTEEKLQGGIKHGADVGILWDRAAKKEDLIQLTKDKTGGGIDGIVDFVGITATGSKAIACINKGGTYIAVGLSGGTLPVPMVPTILNDIRVEGSMVGNLEHLKELIKVFVEKDVKKPPVVLVKPEDTERCLRELEAGTFQGRYIIDWSM